MLENIIIVLHRNLEHVAYEISSKLQRALLGPFFRESLDGLGGFVHRIVQRVDLRFVLRNNHLPSGSELRRENEWFLGG